MKIDYVIVSSDDNPLYLDFWEIVKRLWIDLIGIKPILVKISDNDNVEELNMDIFKQIVASFDNFINFLKDDTIIIDYTYTF
jgi:hypothetical protein